MKAILKRLHHREEGQALVELALVLPILLLLIFGIIDFGIAINQYNDATNLANIGAREVSVYSSSSTAPNCPNGTASTSLTDYIDCMGAEDNSALANATVVVNDSGPGTTYTTGDTISVEVCTDFSWLKLITGGLGRIGGISLSSTIDSTAYMRDEATNNTTPSWITNGASSSC